MECKVITVRPFINTSYINFYTSFKVDISRKRIICKDSVCFSEIPDCLKERILKKALFNNLELNVVSKLAVIYIIVNLSTL